MQSKLKYKLYLTPPSVEDEAMMKHSKYCTQMIFRATYSRDMTSHAMWSLNTICQSQVSYRKLVHCLSFPSQRQALTESASGDYRFLRARTIAGSWTRWITITRSSDQQILRDSNCLSPSSKYWDCLPSLCTGRRLTNLQKFGFI